MGRFFLLFIFALPINLSAVAQDTNFEDGFEDGDFTNNPSWTGDIMDFTVIDGDPNFLLQLDGDDENGGVSYLSTPSTGIEGSWEFYINIGVSPSNGNRADIFLMSDIENLEGAVSGYALRAGENGSDDVFRLVRYDNGSEAATILSGTTDISAGGGFRVKVTRAAGGDWSLEVAKKYDGILNPEGGTAVDNTYTSSGYFGVRVTYTSTRFDQFIFDFKIDLPPFTISEITASGSQLDVIFNRPYDATTIETGDFSVDKELGNPSSVTFTDDTTVTLNYESAIPSNRYTLTVNDIDDYNGETIAANTTSTFIIFGNFSDGDVIINEFVYDPPVSFGEEYIELRNTSGKYLNLQDWSVEDDGNSATISSSVVTLEPDSFIVVSPDTAALFGVFGSRAYVQSSSMPTLNNTGDIIKIITDAGTTADSLAYTSDWGGIDIALERRAPEASSVFRENWDDSPNPDGGTPGLPNEVTRDNTPPELTGLEIDGAQTIRLAFNERLEETSASEPGNFNLSGNPTINSASFLSPDSVELSLSDPLQNATEYTLAISGVQDIFGNTHTGSDSTFTYYEISPVDSGDVFINEFSYDPPDGSTEYIELYNPTSKSLDLQGWTINDNTGNLRTITTSQHVLPPDSFVVIAPDNTLKENFPNIPLITLSSFNALNNGGDDIVLRDNSGTLLDSLRYTSGWGGSEVALERRSISVSGTFVENWGDAPNNFGTPGSANRIESDQNPPELHHLEITDAQTVKLVFSERIDSFAAENTENFSFSNGISIQSAAFASPDSVELSLDSPLQNTADYTLSVENIEDIFGNVLAPIDTSFTFYEVSPVDSGDVFVNEFMFNPPPGQTEYIEIYNRSPKSLDLQGWTLNDNTGNRQIITGSQRIVPPDSFIVIAPDNTLKTDFPDISLVTMSSFPFLNNSGDDIVLRNTSGVLLDSLQYTSEWGGNSVAIERRTTDVSGIFIENWGDAPNDFGTPGSLNYIKPDATPPSFDRLTVQSATSLQLIFSENLDPDTAAEAANYTITPAKNIQLIATNRDTVTLFLASRLESGQTYEVTVDNISDIFGNFLNNATRSVEYLELSAPEAGEIIINEILYTRAQGGGPEFVELYNISDKNFDLTGWRLGDASGTTPIDDGIQLKSGEYLVLTDNTSFAGNLANGQHLSSFPSLNDTGDAVFIQTGDGTTIDSLQYSNTWGGNQHGVSLERKDPQAASNDASNWRSSDTNTPGERNAGFEEDTEPPAITFSKFVSAGSIEVRFSEFIRLTENLSFSSSGETLSILNFDPNHANTITLSAPSRKAKSDDVRITAQNLTDVKGNTTPSHEVPVAQPLSSANIVINEIMYNPLREPDDNQPDQSEYIEIRNTEDYAVSLEGVFIHDEPDENGNVRALLPVSTQAKWIPARGHVLVYADPAEKFEESQVAIFFDLSSIDPSSTIRIDRGSLSLSSTNDAVYLADSTGSAIDSVFYDDSWHNPNLIDTRGIALERIDPSGPSNSSENWSSSTEPSGGTPARENTIYQTGGQIPGETGISFDPNPFSPDDDGYEDNLFINYRLDEPDYLIKVTIFDRYGRLVRKLADGKQAGFEGSLIWDGRKDDGSRNRIGIYIVVFEAYNSDTGQDRAFKNTVVIARKLN